MSEMPQRRLRVMAFGVGAFTQGMLEILREQGAEVATYLTRDYAHAAPGFAGPTFDHLQFPDPLEVLKQWPADFMLPMSIDWALQPWTQKLLDSGMPIFCPSGEGLRLERERDFARELCREHGIAFPKSFFARTRAEAEIIVRREGVPFVLKNPLCAPLSPIQTIVCETVEDTLSWLPRLDDREGVFLQEYMGRAEAGHIAFVSGGELYSVVTNQEYKRAFAGNMGIVAGAPLGGLVEKDPTDKYGLARELLRPLMPWFRKTGFHGPVQVTAIRRDNRWYVLEYNVRIGVTSGPMILRLLEKPLEVVHAVCRNEPLDLRFHADRNFGCNLTLAGFGYPYTTLLGPRVPVEFTAPIDCDLWWNEIERDAEGRTWTTGHRLCDVIAVRNTLAEAITDARTNIARIRCLGSYYRDDVGQSLWPPGEA